MQNAAFRGAPAQSDDRDNIYRAVVADLSSLIEQIQASMALIEAAVAQEASAALQEMAPDVVVLDDVTPCYLKAGAALRACDSGLTVALHFLLEPVASDAGRHDPAGNHHLASHGPDRTSHSAINWPVS